MWNRIYLSVLAACAAIMAGLNYYSWSWLQSIGAPQAANEGFLYHSGLSWTFLWISSIALLILANFVLGKYRRAWAMWTTFVYFGVFVVIKSFVLERSFFQFKQASGLAESNFTLAPIAGVLLCVSAAAIVYANQFTVVRLHARIYPGKVEPEAEPFNEIVDNVPKD